MEPSEQSSVTTLVNTPTLDAKLASTDDIKTTLIAPCTSLKSQAPIVADESAAELTSLFRTDLVSPTAHRLPKVTTTDLAVIRALGNGGQATVWLIKHLPTDRLFALKMVAKHSLPRKNNTRVFEEQDMLRRLAGDSRFLQLQASFEDDEYFYFMTVSRFGSLLCASH